MTVFVIEETYRIVSADDLIEKHLFTKETIEAHFDMEWDRIVGQVPLYDLVDEMLRQKSNDFVVDQDIDGITVYEVREQ